MTVRSAGFGTAVRQTFTVIIAAIGGTVTLATVVAFFGSTWWFFDYLANFRWHFMWIALICAIAYALLARGVIGIAFAIAVAINLWLIAPLYIGNQPSATGEDSVKVVTVDMHGGVVDDESALRFLFDSDAELIIVSGVATSRINPIIVDGSPYQIIANPPEDRTGIVVLGQDAYSVSTRTTPTFDETVLSITVPAGARTIDIVTSWGFIGSNGDRAAALEERFTLTTEVVTEADGPVAVVGSLGATRWTAPMRTLVGDAGLRDAMEGRGYLSTWPVSDFPLIGGWIGIPIDVVLMSPGITPLSLVTGPDIGAPHLPVTTIIGPSGG